MRAHSLVFVISLSSTLVACGDDGRRGPPDGTADAAPDAADATTDGSVSDGRVGDASPDAGPPDGSLDAAVDGDADTSVECTTDLECDDSDLCTGTENCMDGFCVSVDAPMCDDADPCTADSCDPATGCESALVDGDGDGYASTTLDPSCGDCNDAEASAYPGAPDTACDGIDSDCDTMIDEDGIVTHYADCDGDRYPAAGAQTTLACATPSTPPSSCPTTATAATWTTVSSWTDCNDDDAGVSPGVSGYRDTPIPGAPASVDYDYNCDGVEEQRWTALGGCVPSGSSSGSACTLTEGWETTVPDCGESGFYVDSCAMSPGPGGMWECLARGRTLAAPCR